MENNNEVLLRVEHLCQYFKMGRKELKAVDDVSFEIKKGEVFGLVGESGCGKTTTGRSIIKLYDITSGNIYFKGQRICAGTRSYREEISSARAACRAEIKEAKEAAKADPSAKMQAEERIAAARRRCAEIVARNNAAIASAKRDHRTCDREYAQTLVDELKREYEPKLAASSGNEEELKKLKKELATSARLRARQSSSRASR